MKAKWKISPIPQSPNPNQRPQPRSGLLVPVARTAGPRSALRTPRTLWTNARFRCLKATPAGFPLPPGTPGKETQFSHYVNRGTGHVDRHVCRDDCLAQRHGDVAGGGVQGPTAARPRVIAQHRAVIARRSRVNAVIEINLRT